MSSATWRCFLRLLAARVCSHGHPYPCASTVPFHQVKTIASRGDCSKDRSCIRSLDFGTKYWPTCACYVHSAFAWPMWSCVTVYQFTSSFIGAGSSVSVDSSAWFNPSCRCLRKAALVGSFWLRIFVNSRSGHRLSSVKIKETVNCHKRAVNIKWTG